MAFRHSDPSYSLPKAREFINEVCQFVSQSVSFFVCVPQTQVRFGPRLKCSSLPDRGGSYPTTPGFQIKFIFEIHG